MEVPSDHRPAVEAAQRRALTVGAVASVVVAVVLAVIVSILLGALALVVLGAGWVLLVQSAFARAQDRVVAGIGREVRPDELPGFRNALEGVALLTGVAEPAIRLVDSPAANAMAAAGAAGSTVVVTSGILERDSPVESEVLAAELLCRVRDGSARYATLVAGLPPAVRLAAGLSESSLASTFGEQWALRGDFDAVAVTRYPPGLICAFEKMQERGTKVAGVAPSTAPMWIAPAVGRDAGVAEAVDRVANQPISYRIDALREL
jgi:hypothetical protein